MRNLILALSIISINLICSGQSVNETIDYINDKLAKYDHTTFLSNTMNSKFAPDWDITSLKKWAITENGEVTIQQLIIEEGIESIGYEIKFFAKALSDSIEITSGLDMYKRSYYDITIRCKTYGCMISTSADDPTSEKMDSYSFSLTDDTYSQRVANAIGRLIELSNEKKEYFEDDPFK